jgi:hypothetical protein
MRRAGFVVALALCAVAAALAQEQWTFRGTVTKMRMTDCTAQHGFMMAMSGAPPAAASCPEYTIVSDKVVYVVVGRKADEFIPLAENKQFVIRKNEIVLFSDDEKMKSRFSIQQMILRSEWDREEADRAHVAAMIERSISYDVSNSGHSSVLQSGTR